MTDKLNDLHFSSSEDKSESKFQVPKDKNLAEPAPVEKELNPTPHDPLGEILVQNVLTNQAFEGKPIPNEHPRVTTSRVESSLNPMLEDPQDSNIKHHKYLMSQPTLTRILFILKTHGMDSQQSEKALKEIKQIIEERFALSD